MGVRGSFPSIPVNPVGVVYVYILDDRHLHQTKVDIYYTCVYINIPVLELLLNHLQHFFAKKALKVVCFVSLSVELMLLF